MRDFLKLSATLQLNTCSNLTIYINIKYLNDQYIFNWIEHYFNCFNTIYGVGRSLQIYFFQIKRMK